MTIETTYTNARQQLKSLLDAAGQDHETVIIKRRGQEDVALVAAAELRSLEETAHLLRSPANAIRLFEALEDAEVGRGVPMTIEQLRKLVGLDADEESKGA